jgi:hypothetical protein
MILPARGGLLTPAAAAAGDPYWSSVGALIQFNGANGGSSITDAKSGSTLTVTGVTTATDIVKFGSASGKFTATSPYNVVPVRLPNTAGLNLTGDFTLEAWVYFTTTNPDQVILGCNPMVGNQQFRVNHDSSGKIGLYPASVTNVWAESGVISLSANTWHHVAVTREGTTIRFYADGNQVGANVAGNSWVFDFRNGIVGNYDGAIFTGRMDDLRITSVARYTGSTYTVPASEFPNF